MLPPKNKPNYFFTTHKLLFYTMNFQTILFSIDQHIATITINRPDKLNALNAEVINEISVALDEVFSNAEIRSAIITGAGTKSFVAGADISEFPSMNSQAGEALSTVGHEKLFAKIENAPKPIVAAVNGFALGGGCELAMACHFRLASENAKFGQPEVNLGLIPGYGGTQRLVQLIGKGKAMELCLSAAIIDATEAKSLGLVNYVCTSETLLEQTIKILHGINSKAPLALAKTIACINAAHIHTGFALETKLFGECFDTQDKNEGVDAFLNKRKAEFKGA
jgi:enoyl-CoA hydratase